jgi:hypothetical protein
MSTEATFILIGVLIVAFLVLLLGLRVPPLYGPPEKNGKPEVEPPDNHKPSH